jgi:zinc protease
MLIAFISCCSLVIYQIAFGVTSIHANSSLSPYTKVKLDNGLTLIVKEVHSSPIAAVDIWVGTGVKNETPDETGISHFFEHMLFKGTAKRQVGEIAQEIKAVGGYQNAQTSLDTTHYFVVVPSEKINLAMDVEADAIMNSTFDPQEIDRERQVILEEKRLKEDNPQGKLGLMAYQAVFKGTPYANDILGTAESLAKINQQTFLAYYHKFYIPNNIVEVVVGDIDTVQIVNQAKQLFKDFKAQKKANIPDFPLPRIKSVVRVAAKMPVDQTYLYFGFPGPGMKHQDIPALSILAEILGGGEGSRFNQDLLEKKQLVNAVYAGYQSYQKIGMFVIYLQSKAAKTATIESEVQNGISIIIDKGVTADELSRAKAMVKSDVAYSMETDADIASIIGEYQINRNVEDATGFVLGLQKVTMKDVQRVAKEYLNPEGYVLAMIQPQEAKP